MPEPEEKLTWPPSAEDLRRLYVEEHLSAAKIASRYGLKYANPKTAESTVLYHLKRNGISRRDKAEHIRRATEKMVDEWTKRYEAGESLKKIAGTEFSPVTVLLHLRKRGVQLRDKVEAQIAAITKYERAPFRGDRSDQAYILGFVWGDCSVEKHGRAVRVRSGTTHPEFVNLFNSLFASYGHIRMYPKLAKITLAEWNLEVDLHESFGFLLEKKLQVVPKGVGPELPALSFIAGFADAEGSIFFHQNRMNFEFQISNTNIAVLQSIRESLESKGYNPRIFRSYSGAIGPSGKVSILFRLGLHRPDEVRRLLGELPLRHNEKVTKARIALKFMNSESEIDADGIPEGWTQCLAEIALEVDEFIKSAYEAIGAKNSSQSLLS